MATVRASFVPTLPRIPEVMIGNALSRERPAMTDNRAPVSGYALIATAAASGWLRAGMSAPGKSI